MLERLQVSPADRVDAPNCHPYIVVYHLTDEQEAKLKNITELANRYHKAKKDDFAETPADFLQGAMSFGSARYIDDALSRWERAYNEGLEKIKNDA